MIRLLKTAVARVQDAQAAMPSDLDGMACALGDLDELLGVLSSYTRRLSSAVESLPDLTEDLRVNEQDGPVPPQVVCNQIAIHTQAAAAGIDQARTAVSVLIDSAVGSECKAIDRRRRRGSRTIA